MNQYQGVSNEKDEEEREREREDEKEGKCMKKK